MRRPRIHVAGGLYYLVLRAVPSRVLCATDADYTLCLRLLVLTTKRHRAKLLAYCMLPRSLHVAVKLGDVPTSKLLHEFTSRYARAVHERDGRAGAVFKSHHRVLLVDPDYRRQLVRFIHWVAVSEGYARQPQEYPHSSHTAYCGARTFEWLDIGVVLQEHHARADITRRRCAAYMTEPPSPECVQGFTRGSPGEPRVFGKPGFLRQVGVVPRFGLISSLAEVAELIQSYCGITSAELMSARRGAAARALVAWYAERRGIASLTQTARFLRRHWSTLRSGIRSHQHRSPELFDMTAIHRRTRPLVRMPDQPRSGR